MKKLKIGLKTNSGHIGRDYECEERVKTKEFLSSFKEGRGQVVCVGTYSLRYCSGGYVDSQITVMYSQK